MAPGQCHHPHHPVSLPTVVKSTFRIAPVTSMLDVVAEPIVSNTKICPPRSQQTYDLQQIQPQAHHQCHQELHSALHIQDEKLVAIELAQQQDNEHQHGQLQSKVSQSQQLLDSDILQDSSRQDTIPHPAHLEFTLPPQSVTQHQETYNSHLPLNTLEQKVSQRAGTMEVNPHKSSLRLQELQSLSSVINKFDGDSSRYQRFKARFCTIADSMTLTEPDKGLLLYISLEDDVLDYLGNITEEGCINYRKLWSELDYEYDPPQHGICTHIAALFSISSMSTCDSLDKLIKLYKFVKLHYLALKNLGAGNEVEGFRMQLLSKLCGTVSEKVSGHMIDAEGKPVVPDILDILRREINVMELEELAASLSGDVPEQGDDKLPPKEVIGPADLNGNVPEQGDHKELPSKEVIGPADVGTTAPQQSLTSILKPSSVNSQCQQFNCLFCMTNTHHSNTCKRYRTPSDYQQVLFQHRRCYNCYGYGHKSYACPRPKECSLCHDNRKHSPVLCKHNYSHLHYGNNGHN